MIALVIFLSKYLCNLIFFNFDIFMKSAKSKYEEIRKLEYETSVQFPNSMNMSETIIVLYPLNLYKEQMKFQYRIKSIN